MTRSLQQLPDATRATIASRLCELFADEFDRELSTFQAGTVIDLFLEHLAPRIYNQGVSDTRDRLQSLLDDLEADVHLPTPVR